MRLFYAFVKKICGSAEDEYNDGDGHNHADGGAD